MREALRSAALDVLHMAAVRLGASVMTDDQMREAVAAVTRAAREEIAEAHRERDAAQKRCARMTTDRDEMQRERDTAGADEAEAKAVALDRLQRCLDAGDRRTRAEAIANDAMREGLACATWLRMVLAGRDETVRRQGATIDRLRALLTRTAHELGNAATSAAMTLRTMPAGELRDRALRGVERVQAAHAMLCDEINREPQGAAKGGE